VRKKKNMSQKLILCSFWALLLCIDSVTFSAQGCAPPESPCFSIHVRLNGKPLDGPRVITLLTDHSEIMAHQEGGCFKVPSNLLAEKKIDVFFTVPGNKVHLFSIATGFFAGPWDINLEDKEFGSDVVLPKNAHPSEACEVVFHVGEPERGLLQTGCRSPE
jgi:hypothetical protein